MMTNNTLLSFSRSSLLEKLHSHNISGEEFFFIQKNLEYFNSEGLELSSVGFEINVYCKNTSDQYMIYYNYDLTSPIVEKINI